jgi:hypothetical protein
MTVRSYRDAAPDGVTEITDTGAAAAGYTTLARHHPGALPALSAPKAAWFGTPADGYRGAVCEPAGAGAPAAAAR